MSETYRYSSNKKYIDYDYNLWKSENLEFNKIINKIDLNNFKAIDLGYVFCDQKTCDFKSQNEYYFLDHVHFTYFGSKLLANEILDFLNP